MHNPALTIIATLPSFTLLCCALHDNENTAAKTKIDNLLFMIYIKIKFSANLYNLKSYANITSKI